MIVQERGARCDECALRALHETNGSWTPVPGENLGQAVVVITDFPSARDAKDGRPITGEEWEIVAGAYEDDASWDRSRFSWMHRIACPMVISPYFTERAIKKLRAKTPELLHPEAACAPRYLHEVQASAHSNPVLFVAGARAFHGLFPKRSDPMAKVHGSLVHAEGYRVVPSVDLHFAARRGRWKRFVHHALRQAERWQRDEIAWEEPAMLGDRVERPPTYEQIKAKLIGWRKKAQYVAYDVETTGRESLRSRLRMIQLSTADDGIAIPIRTKQGRDAKVLRDKQRGKVVIPPSAARYYPFFYKKDELRRILRLLRSYFNNPGKNTLVGVNNWIFDDHVLEVEGELWLGESLAPPHSVDLMVARQISDSESPRSLAFLGQLFSVVIDWKAGKGNGWDADTDNELAVYGIRDGAVTARVAPGVLAGLDAPDGGGDAGFALLEDSEEMAAICRGMKSLGYHVDQQERARLEAKYAGIYTHNMRLLAAALYRGGHTDVVERVGPDQYDFKRDKKGVPYFNINSTDQMRELLYSQWDLPPPRDLITPFDPEEQDLSEWLSEGMRAKFLTQNGEPSTGDPILRAYLAEHHTQGLLEDFQADAMKVLRKCRKAQKLISDKLRTTRLLDPSDYDKFGYPKPRKKGSDWPITAVWADGVLRTGWKLGTGIGRLSSGDPFNLQNMAKVLRAMLVAAPGHVLVGADSDQIHLKIIGNVWGIPSLIDDFRLGRDPHCTMAELAFQDAWFEALRQTGGNFKIGLPGRYRGWGKTIRYTGAYGGQPGAIHSVMQKADDDDWNLTNLDVRLEMVEAFYDAWMEREPEWKQAWRRAIESFEQNGYVEEGWSGRRCYFRDGTHLNTKVPNWQILGEEAAVMRQVTRRVARRIPFKSWSPFTGIVEQCHDALVVQVPEDKAELAARIVEEEMNIGREDRLIMYTAKADIGRSRYEVAC